jgi:hypothetical protein
LGCTLEFTLAVVSFQKDKKIICYYHSRINEIPFGTELFCENRMERLWLKMYFVVLSVLGIAFAF